MERDYAYRLAGLLPPQERTVCDCGVLTVPGCDIRLVVYTVAAGSTDAEKLEFLRVTDGVRADGPAPPGLGLFSTR
ncbi:hypothetical protein ACFWAZ_08815 [Streptomyces collinus]|uniref:hypothetical protein n=1 Tax=Streptomyces collinus TaxID=42684 RepID=UPI0036625257